MHRIASALFLVFALLTSIFLGAVSAHAGENTWTGLGPDGGYIERVVFHTTSPNIVYARASGGFFRSTDGGAHWQQPQPYLTSHAQDVAIDPLDANRVYIAGARQPRRVMVSTDAGATFANLAALPSADSAPTLIAVSADGGTLYAMGTTSVFRSADRGKSWQQRGAIESSRTFGGNRAIVDPSDADTLYVARNDELFVTRDGGSSWANIAPASNGTVEDVAVDSADPQRIWIATLAGLQLSTNRGATWSNIDNSWTTALALDPQAPSTLYVGKIDGTVLRRSGGTSTNITNDLQSIVPAAIAVSPHGASHLLLANGRGLWTTANGGGHWARSDAGLVSSAVTGISIASSRNRIYVRGNALAKLDDGSDVVTELDAEPLFQELGGRSIPFDTLVPTIDSSGGLLSAKGTLVVRSLDDGATWSSTGYASINGDTIQHLVATSSAPSVYYASSALTLQRSTDQGATWATITTGLPTDMAPGIIAIAPSNQSVLYAGPRSVARPDEVGVGVYKSTNGGDSWTPANASMADHAILAFAIHPANPDIVYAGTNRGLMKTLNGGATWTKVPWSPSTAVSAVLIDPRAPDVIYVTAGDRFTNAVARSTDGGATWQELAQPAVFFPWHPTAIALDLARPDTLRIGTGTGGIRQISFRPESQPDLSIELSEPGTEVPLEIPMRLRYTVSNIGSGPSGHVKTTIQLPQLRARVSSVTAIPTVGSCTVAESEVTCDAPDLIANDKLQIALTLTPTAGESIELVSSVQATALDSDPSNNTIHSRVTTPEQADLSIVIGGPATAQVDTPLQYTATLTNAGPSTATEVFLVFQLPGGMTREGFGISQGTCDTSTTNAIECKIATLSPGASAILTVRGSVKSALTYHLTANGGTPHAIDPAPANNSGQFVTVVSAQPSLPGPSGGSGGTSGGGGGGGGGATSLLTLLALLGLVLRRALIRSEAYLPDPPLPNLYQGSSEQETGVAR